MRLLERTSLARWRRSTVRPSTGLVLEIGAGTGLDFGYYVSGTTVIASDVDVEMLERARQKVGTAAATVLLVVADAEALPFRRGTFDTGVGGLVLCTIPYPGRALAEVRRVLKPGASLRLLEHVRMPNQVVARIQHALTPIWMRIARGCRLDRDAVEIVSRAGFALESVVPHACGYVVEIVGRPQRDESSRLATEEVHDESVVSSAMGGLCASLAARD